MSARSAAVVRPRLVVVQVLLVALFATLLGRLWFIQVASGESYRAQAQDNAVQDVVVQPQRGLIVDDQGRPLAVSRSSWVVSVDRTALAGLDEDEQEDSLRRLAQTVGMHYPRVVARTKLCGEDGAPVAGVCWNGSPYQPVTIAEDVSQQVAVSLQEQAEDYPAVVIEQRSVRSYPSPFGMNAAHLLGYLTPVTADELAVAQKDGDQSLNGGSLVGRSGLERAYDSNLRGQPGSNGVGVDSLGRTTGDTEATPATPGDTLVTSIDARVQATVERELEQAIRIARRTFDDITGRRYKATSGAALVLDPRDGSVVAMASYPTYDPALWVGGIGTRQLARLYSKKAGEPLLSRPTQGQLAPGSTFKPFMAAGALATDDFSTRTRLNCSSSLQVGNRSFANFESGAYGYIGFDKALQVSCNTFFYRVGYELWQQAGGDSAGPKAESLLADAAKAFGFGSATGVDLPGEADGRIADPQWKLSYYRAMKDYYCELAEEGGTKYIDLFAREFCIEGWKYRAGDAVNFVIGQGDTMVTPLQLATAYGAISNGGTLWEPRLAEAVLGPDGELVRRIEPTRAGRVPFSRASLRYIDDALLETTRSGTYAWKMGGFPLDTVPIRSKTGTAEVQGKQTTGWLATYNEDYVVVMMIEQAGTGSGSSGDAVRTIWEALYGIDGEKVRPAEAAIPGVTPPQALPRVQADGSIVAPLTRRARQ
ncbi:MAG: penicillin-binding protein 2 [Actinomycetota bacterium]|nr:penicillin-binding protein 2 [Actinomycetota bacterium]